MEQVPQDTAKQILQSRESYQQQLAQASAPLVFPQSQMTIQQGMSSGGFLQGIQYRQQAAATQKQNVQQISSAQNVFEASVARAYPELGKEPYVAKEYEKVSAQLQSNIKSIDDQIATLQKELNTATTSKDRDNLNNQIKTLQQGRAAYAEGLSADKGEAIQKGLDYYNQLAYAYQKQTKQEQQQSAAVSAYEKARPTPAVSTTDFVDIYNKTYQTYLKTQTPENAAKMSQDYVNSLLANEKAAGKQVPTLTWTAATYQTPTYDTKTGTYTNMWGTKQSMGQGNVPVGTMILNAGISYYDPNTSTFTSPSGEKKTMKQENIPIGTLIAPSVQTFNAPAVKSFGGADISGNFIMPPAYTPTLTEGTALKRISSAIVGGVGGTINTMGAIGYSGIPLSLSAIGRVGTTIGSNIIPFVKVAEQAGQTVAEPVGRAITTAYETPFISIPRTEGSSVGATMTLAVVKETGQSAKELRDQGITVNTKTHNLEDHKFVVRSDGLWYDVTSGKVAPPYIQNKYPVTTAGPVSPKQIITGAETVYKTGIGLGIGAIERYGAPVLGLFARTNVVPLIKGVEAKTPQQYGSEYFAPPALNIFARTNVVPLIKGVELKTPQQSISESKIPGAVSWLGQEAKKEVIARVFPYAVAGATVSGVAYEAGKPIIDFFNRPQTLKQTFNEYGEPIDTWVLNKEKKVVEHYSGGKFGGAGGTDKPIETISREDWQKKRAEEHIADYDAGRINKAEYLAAISADTLGLYTPGETAGKIIEGKLAERIYQDVGKARAILWEGLPDYFITPQGQKISTKDISGYRLAGVTVPPDWKGYGMQKEFGETLNLNAPRYPILLTTTPEGYTEKGKSVVETGVWLGSLAAGPIWGPIISTSYFGPDILKTAITEGPGKTLEKHGWDIVGIGAEWIGPLKWPGSISKEYELGRDIIPAMVRDYMVASVTPFGQEINKKLSEKAREEIAKQTALKFAAPNLTVYKDKIQNQFDAEYKSKILNKEITYEKALDEYTKTDEYKNIMKEYETEANKQQSWKSGLKILGLKAIDLITPETPLQLVVVGAVGSSLYPALKITSAIQSVPLGSIALTGLEGYTGYTGFKAALTPTLPKESRILSAGFGTLGAIGFAKDVTTDIKALLPGGRGFTSILVPSNIESEGIGISKRIGVGKYKDIPETMTTATGEKLTIKNLNDVELDRLAEVVKHISNEEELTNEELKTLSSAYGTRVSLMIDVEGKEGKLLNVIDKKSGTVDLPGGAIEFVKGKTPYLNDAGELVGGKFMAPKEAGAKEILEELGLKINPSDLDYQGFFAGTRNHVVYSLTLSKEDYDAIKVGSDVSKAFLVNAGEVTAGTQSSLFAAPVMQRAPQTLGEWVKWSITPKGGLYNSDAAQIIQKFNTLPEIRLDIQTQMSSMSAAEKADILKTAQNWISTNYGKQFVEAFKGDKAIEEYMLAQQGAAGAQIGFIGNFNDYFENRWGKTMFVERVPVGEPGAGQFARYESKTLTFQTPTGPIKIWQEPIFLAPGSEYKFGPAVAKEYVGGTIEEYGHGASGAPTGTIDILGTEIPFPFSKEFTVSKPLYFQPPLYPGGPYYAGLSYLGLGPPSAESFAISTGKTPSFLMGNFPSPVSITPSSTIGQLGTTSKVIAGQELESTFPVATRLRYLYDTIFGGSDYASLYGKRINLPYVSIVPTTAEETVFGKIGQAVETAEETLGKEFPIFNPMESAQVSKTLISPYVLSSEASLISGVKPSNYGYIPSGPKISPIKSPVEAPYIQASRPAFIGEIKESITSSPPSGPKELPKSPESLPVEYPKPEIGKYPSEGPYTSPEYLSVPYKTPDLLKATGVVPPLLKEEQKKPQKGKPAKGYEVLIRRRKKFVEAAPFSFPTKTEAISFGARTTLGEAAATFRVVPSAKPVTTTTVAPVNVGQYFRAPKSRGVRGPDTYVQLGRKRIISAGEKREISFAGIAARTGRVRPSVSFAPKKTPTTFLKSKTIKSRKKFF